MKKIIIKDGETFLKEIRPRWTDVRVSKYDVIRLLNMYGKYILKELNIPESDSENI